MRGGGTNMIALGTPAPDFELRDQFYRLIKSSNYRGKKHMLLLFYPLDFTGT